MSTATPIAPKHETYCIVTYGCQMNDNDSEIMSGILEGKGMRRVQTEAEADVVLVNTCVVREGAEERAVGRLNSLASLKKQKPGMIVGITGCMAQNEGEMVSRKVPLADLVVGTRDLFKIGELVDRAASTRERIVSIQDVDKPVFLQNQPVRRKHGLKAFTTIMYGCNNFCSFCIVPRTRGREVSRPRADVVSEVRQLVQQGYKEVMLLGQNVNSYEHNGDDFADLLSAVNDVEGLERIRFITSHPKDCSDKLIDTVASLPKLCTNFHLPVQAGSNRVLRRMKRFYTRDHYLDLIRRVRERVPGATISTDVICGFPDETEEDFEETRQLLEEARWDSAFIFGYSPREGTKAAEWQDSIPGPVKKQRVHSCIQRQELISGEINRTYEASIQQVLVESVSKRREHEMMGRTKGDKCVVFAGSADLIGELVNVKITDSHAHTLFGIAV
ncbi:MAG: tRNA (N6-isopentenyl adenosine(37)-C2)-methylthiotransferase MiaB [Candidatus Sumerlaeaceae bacterium]